MLRATHSSILAPVVFLAGCSALVETNEQACVRANARAVTCLLESQEIPEDQQEFADLALELSLATIRSECAKIPDVDGCDFRPVASCLESLECVDFGANEPSDEAIVCETLSFALSECGAVLLPVINEPIDSRAVVRP